MQMNIDIKLLNMILGYLLLVIPIYVFWYYRSGLIKETLLAIGRMTLQLLLVGVYLEYLFKLNNYWINAIWLLFIVFVASWTIIKRSDLSIKIFIVPVLLSLLLSVVFTDFYFIRVIIMHPSFFDASYLIPITGIIVGNCLRTNILALSNYYQQISKNSKTYRYYLANGASRGEALQPYMKDALKNAFNPTIANISVVGLINMPGVMTGQILGGSNPIIAIKYQILFLLFIFVSAMISVVLSILLANKKAFDASHNLLDNIFNK